MKAKIVIAFALFVLAFIIFGLSFGSVVGGVVMGTFVSALFLIVI